MGYSPWSHKELDTTEHTCTGVYQANDLTIMLIPNDWFKTSFLGEAETNQVKSGFCQVGFSISDFIWGSVFLFLTIVMERSFLTW